MAVKHESPEEFNSTLTANSKLVVSGSLLDNNNQAGTSGQVLSKDGTGNVVWSTPSGGGGSLTGSGTADTMTKWSSSTGLTDSSHMTEDATGIIIGGGSASAKLHVKDDVKFGTDALFYDASAKRIGLGTITPAQLLHVNGNMRLEGVFQDGLNSSGTSGQVLTSTGTDTQWRDPEDLGYRDNKTFHATWKSGTAATEFLNHATSGAGSLGYATLFPVPYAGVLNQIKIIANASYSSISVALVNYTGSVIYNSGTISLTANTVYTLNPGSSITTAHRAVGFRIIRPTATNNGNWAFTATFEWDN